MGYTTDFSGSIVLHQPLKEHEIEYLTMFSETRRMMRDPTKIAQLTDDMRNQHCLDLLEKCGLGLGPRGDFYCGFGSYGQSHDASIIDFNVSPGPGLWCQWIPSGDNNDEISWDGSEKFSNYVAWMKYLIDNFLKPWGYICNGEIEWQGEEPDDRGKIVVKNNVVSTQRGYIVYKEVLEDD